MSSSGSAAQGDQLGDFINQNMPQWEQRQANYDRIVEVFSQANVGDPSNDVQVAGPGGYRPGRVPAAPWAEEGQVNTYTSGQRTVVSDGYEVPLVDLSPVTVTGRIPSTGTLSPLAPSMIGPIDASDFAPTPRAEFNDGSYDAAESRRFSNYLASSGVQLERSIDQQVIAGTYKGSVSSATEALQNGNYSQAWTYLTYTASPAAQAATHDRMYPPVSAATRKFQNDIGIAAGGPVFTGLASMARHYGAPEDVVENFAIAQTGLVTAGAAAAAGAGSVVLRPVGEPAPFSPIGPGGSLQIHEDAGGHLLESHVGKTEQQLLNRLASEPRIKGSSSFYNRATAEAAISDALDARQTDINAWLATPKPGMPFEYTWQDSVGISVGKGATSAVDTPSLRLILRRDATMPNGYRIHTGFPIP